MLQYIYVINIATSGANLKHKILKYILLLLEQYLKQYKLNMFHRSCLHLLDDQSPFLSKYI